MSDQPDGAEFGPASLFLSNLDYFEAVNRDLRVCFEDAANKRLIPGYNVEPEQVEEVALGINVYLTDLTGFHVEQVVVDGEPMDEIVSWVEGGFTFAEHQQNDGEYVQATGVEIVD